jgi:L-alanine-DL-glutamate epimerase-like enolase superfamily enzyme
LVQTDECILNCKMEWTIKKLKLELKYTWKISRNSSEYKENLIVSCGNFGEIGLGEVAPNIRYGETPENLLEEFGVIEKDLRDCPTELAEFETWLNGFKLHNALRFGIESAFIHWYIGRHKISLYSLLGIDEPKLVSTCYTLPIMDVGDIAKFYETHKLSRFNYLKVKVSNEEAIDLVKEITRFNKHKIMIDANEAWKDVDSLLNFIPKLKPYPIEFIEQPMPAEMEDAYAYLKGKSNICIMGDESVLNQPNFDKLERQFDGVNMKLMKAGGYLNGVRILREAKARGMKTMIGCMVESTLGIKSAWSLCCLAEYADLDGCLIVGNEPFGLLKEENGQFIAN